MRTGKLRYRRATCSTDSDEGTAEQQLTAAPLSPHHAMLVDCRPSRPSTSTAIVYSSARGGWSLQPARVPLIPTAVSSTRLLLSAIAGLGPFDGGGQEQHHMVGGTSLEQHSRSCTDTFQRSTRTVTVLIATSMAAAGILHFSVLPRAVMAKTTKQYSYSLRISYSMTTRSLSYVYHLSSLSLIHHPSLSLILPVHPPSALSVLPSSPASLPRPQTPPVSPHSRCPWPSAPR